LSSLLCLGRHTVTGLISTCGQEFDDWTSAYRLFSHHRLPIADIFGVIRNHVLDQLPAHAPLCVAMDDSLLRKSGQRIPGTAWRRDPTGPHFRPNFIWAQRFLQISADLPLPDGDHRMIPIFLQHAPTPRKPSSKAPASDWTAYREASRQAALPMVGYRALKELRRSIDATPGGRARRLIAVVDGGYTNRRVLRNLPSLTTLIGRIRKDAKLYFLPQAPPQAKRPGRPRRYGAPAPTPEALRIDDSVTWQTIPITIAGTVHPMRVKILRNLLWRTAGLGHQLQLVVIAGLGYRLRKGSKVLYRQPAYLICTDSQLDVAILLQDFVRRWDIEVNFREEKTLLGVGQAQVRNPNSVHTVPAFQVACYAMLLLAMLQVCKASPTGNTLPSPKWAAPQPKARLTAQRAISQLRAEVWGQALGLTNFSDFVASAPPTANPQNLSSQLASAIIYAST
jgi:hypothetical protein